MLEIYENLLNYQVLQHLLVQYLRGIKINLCKDQVLEY